MFTQSKHTGSTTATVSHTKNHHEEQTDWGAVFAVAFLAFLGLIGLFG